MSNLNAVVENLDLKSNTRLLNIDEMTGNTPLHLVRVSILCNSWYKACYNVCNFGGEGSPLGAEKESSFAILEYSPQEHLNHKNHEGETPLNTLCHITIPTTPNMSVSMLAILINHSLTFFNELLKRGADPNLANDDGEYPLSLLLKSHSQDLANIIIQHPSTFCSHHVIDIGRV